MREVRVRCTWESDHVIEVPDDAPQFGRTELDEVLAASDGEDVTSEVAELVDWNVTDRGPKP